MSFFGKKEENNESESVGETGQGKYNESCSVCGKAPCDKKWGGQYFHKKCFRRLKKMGKGML